MTTEIGLYYPTIEFKNDAWVKLAVLYWDKYGGPLCQDRKISQTKSYFPPFQVLFVLPSPS